MSKPPSSGSVNFCATAAPQTSQSPNTRNAWRIDASQASGPAAPGERRPRLHGPYQNTSVAEAMKVLLLSRRLVLLMVGTQRSPSDSDRLSASLRS